MRKRYKNTKIEQFDNKSAHGSVRKRQVFNKYNTTLYSNVPQSNSDIYVITQAGDRLDNLSFEFYNDVQFWWIIAAANPNKIRKDSYYVPLGEQIRIPSNPSQYVNTFVGFNNNNR